MIDSLSKDKEVKDIDLKLRIGLSRFESRTVDTRTLAHKHNYKRRKVPTDKSVLAFARGVLFFFCSCAWCECVSTQVFAILRISIYASGRKAI